jgi:hypothetical protein
MSSAEISRTTLEEIFGIFRNELRKELTSNIRKILANIMALDHVSAEKLNAGDVFEFIEYLASSHYITKEDVTKFLKVVRLTEDESLESIRLLLERYQHAIEEEKLLVYPQVEKKSAPQTGLSYPNLHFQHLLHRRSIIKNEDLQGDNIVLGILDIGCDFAHSNFRNQDGTTRLLAIYDLGTGKIYNRKKINAALKTSDPYTALGYTVSKKSHGTCVMDIGGGNGRGTGISGIAPKCHLVFVDMGNSPDTFKIVRAIKWLFEHPHWRRLPIVANVSFCRNTGPHDGSTLVELALDRLLIGYKNRAITISAGNYRDKGWHTHGEATRNNPATVSWQLPKQPATIELWYPSDTMPTFNMRQPFRITVGAPNCQHNEQNFTVSHERYRLNSQNVLKLSFTDADAPPTTCELEISTEGKEVLYHAWIEHNANKVRFDNPTTENTLGL